MHTEPNRPPIFQWPYLSTQIPGEMADQIFEPMFENPDSRWDGPQKKGRPKTGLKNTPISGAWASTAGPAHPISHEKGALTPPQVWLRVFFPLLRCSVTPRFVFFCKFLEEAEIVIINFLGGP